MNDSQSQLFAIGQGTDASAFEKICQKRKKDTVIRGFLRERSLSAEQSDTGTGSTGDQQIFCHSFLFKVMKSGTSPMAK